MKPRRAFPDTRWSRVSRAGDGDRVALNELCAAYHEPLLAVALYLTRDPARAEDLVQGFLERFVAKNVASSVAASRVDCARCSFRAFLCTSLRNYRCNVLDGENAEKRGGGVEHVDSDEAVLTGGLAAERIFNRSWARALLDRALARLREEEIAAGRGPGFEALRDRLLDEGDAAPLRQTAEALGQTVGAVKVRLHRLRHRHIAVLRAEVAETVDRPEDVDHELYELLSAWDEDT